MSSQRGEHNGTETIHKIGLRANDKHQNDDPTTLSVFLGKLMSNQPTNQPSEHDRNIIVARSYY